jgi:hypothetical protein
MSEFRDLQAKLEKIDESYMSRLAAAVDDIALYNKSMSDEELIALVNTELGDVAAEYMREKLASGETVEEGFGDWMDDLTNAAENERDHRYDHDPSFHDDEPISAQVKGLLAQGKSVICRIAGASGVVYSANPEDGTIVFKDQNIGEKIGFDVDSKTGLEIKGYVDHYAIVQHTDIDEGFGDWVQGKAEKYAQKVNVGTAKRVAELVRDEGIKMTVIHIRYTTGGKGKLIQDALERYIEHSPDGEYAEAIRYVLPALDKDAKTMRDAEISAFGAPFDELGEDATDARGKTCSVCSGGRREGYGNDCPNCGGEGYVEEAVGEELPPIHAIARDIIKNWKKVNFGAVPYLDAMQSLSTRHDDYGADTGSSILAYGLSNMSHYSGRSVHDPELAKVHRAQLKRHLKEAVVEVPAEFRGDKYSDGGVTSQDAERFIANLDPDDSVDTEVIDPESGEVLDWPTQDTRKAQDDAEYEKNKRGREEAELPDYPFTPYIPGGKSAAPGQVQSLDGIDRAMDDLGKLKYDGQITDFYDIVWKNIEDQVDDPQQYYDGDYDIGWDMPVVIRRTDGQKFDDEDHANFRRLSSLFRTATYNIGLGYAGGSESGTAAHFYPMFY